MKFRIMCPLLLLMSFFVKAQTSVITGTDYDKIKDQTVLLLIPQGNITIPGKWVKTGYNQSSRQTFFTDGDSTTVALAKMLKNKYPFKVDDKTDKTFVNAFFKWDSDYWAQQGLTIKILSDKTDDGYIVWQAFSDVKNVNTVFLFGTKNGRIYNFSTSSKRWDDARKEKYLTDLYLSN